MTMILHLPKVKTVIRARSQSESYFLTSRRIKESKASSKIWESRMLKLSASGGADASQPSYLYLDYQQCLYSYSIHSTGINRMLTTEELQRRCSRNHQLQVNRKLHYGTRCMRPMCHSLRSTGTRRTTSSIQIKKQLTCGNRQNMRSGTVTMTVSASE